MTRMYPTTPMCSGEILSRFEPTVRNSDVFTATAAKCGQTWLTTLLYHLKTKAKYPDMEGKGLMGVCPWLEMPRDTQREPKPVPFNVKQRLDDLEAMQDPRIFKMHVLWEVIPRDEAASKIITISRDVREVPYSMYMHMCGLSWGPFAGGSPPPFEEYFAKSFLETTSYFKHLKSFWPQRDNPNLLWLSYEAMLNDPTVEAKKIVDFLGWTVSEEELNQAVELSSFKSMKKFEKTVLMKGSSFSGDFIREGGVGKNCAMLTPEMEETLLKRLYEEVPKEAAEFVLSENVTVNSKAIRDAQAGE